MDNEPQAFGFGRVTGTVNLLEFLQSQIVLLRALCLTVCLMAYSSVNNGSYYWDSETNKQYCIFDKDQPSMCSFLANAAMLGVMLGAVSIGLEYMMWKTTSVKMRRRYVTFDFAACTVECGFCIISFLYVFFSWMGTSVPERVSTSNANFGLFFILLAIFSWGYVTYLVKARSDAGEAAAIQQNVAYSAEDGTVPEYPQYDDNNPYSGASFDQKQYSVTE